MEKQVEIIEKQIIDKGEYWLKYQYLVDGNISEERFHLYHIKISARYGIDIDYVNCPICVKNKSESRKHGTYDRLTYFIKHLERIQGIEDLTLEKEEIDLIKSEIKCIPSLTEQEKTIKRLKMKRLYGHTIKIMKIIYGLEAPRLNSFQVEELKHMFSSIHRKNIPPYKYILYRLFEIMELNKFLSLIDLPNKYILKKYDKIWEEIENDII